MNAEKVGSNRIKSITALTQRRKGNKGRKEIQNLLPEINTDKSGSSLINSVELDVLAKFVELVNQSNQPTEFIRFVITSYSIHYTKLYE